jgi:hypothetical protein
MERLGATTSPAELWTWIAIAVAMTVFFAPSAASAAVAVAAGVAVGWINPRLPVSRHLTATLIAGASWPIFFLLRTNVLNQDGNMLTPKLQRDVPLVGAHLSHDELLELFLHSKVWDYTHRWWGWSVVFSYQVVSCTAGALFIYALVRLSRRLAPERSWLLIVGMLSGAYMQLFFGDVENYTVTASLVALYVLAACRFLAREVRLWVPASVLAIAICFHLEAGWLLPSALYLALVSRARTGDLRESLLGAAAGGGIIALIFVSFHFYGLPLWRFFSTHAGHALRGDGVFAIGMPVSYYADQVRLLLWLCPAVAMLVPLAISLRSSKDEVTRFLAVGAVSMLVFQAVWKALNGVFDDWNLYAIGGTVVALFIWRYVAAAASTVAMRIAAASLVAIGSLHTYAWIIANHWQAP